MPKGTSIARRHIRHGFTIIELIAAMVIVGVLSTVAVPPISGSIDKAKVARAISDMRQIAQDLSALDSLPASLADIGRGSLRDPWGRPYTYVPLIVSGPAPDPRKDRFLVPINSRFDLYSTGPDGLTSLPLSDLPSRDDVVLGNDGGYIGLASKY